MDPLHLDRLGGLRGLAVASALLALATPPALAHGGLFRSPPNQVPPTAPPPPGSPGSAGGSAAASAARERAPFPGSAPSIEFTAERWEHWWEFNHDSWVNLRPSLRHAAAGGGFDPPDASMRSQVLLPALVSMLRADEALVRSAAVHSLARLEDESTLPYLSNAAVGDSSLIVRTHALLALGLARIPKAIERIKTTFLDDRAGDEERAMAAVSLGISGLPEASGVLRDALAGGAESRLPHSVRAATIYAIGLTSDPGNAPFLLAFAQSRNLDEIERALAIESLGKVGDRAANPILLAALDSELAGVRRSAALALGAVAHPDDSDVTKALLRALDSDADAVVRSFAALSLGRIASLGDPDLVEKLIAGARTATARQRPFLALALGLSGYDSALPELLAQFRDESSQSLRGALATAIALLDQTEAVPALRAAFLREREPQLRGYLAYALGRLGDREVTTELRKILEQENDPQLLYWSSVALGLLGDRTAPAWIEQVYSRSNEVVTRASHLHALGAIGDRASAEFLIATARATSEPALVRAFAVSSLGLLCDEERLTRTARFTLDHNYTLSLTFLPELYDLF